MVDQIRKAVGGSKEQPMAKNGPRPTEVCEVCNERITRNTQAEVDADMELHMKAHPSLVSNPLPSLPAPVHAARERQRKTDKAVFFDRQITGEWIERIVGMIRVREEGGRE
jgi:hypothetical protein